MYIDPRDYYIWHDKHHSSLGEILDIQNSTVKKMANQGFKLFKAFSLKVADGYEVFVFCNN